MKAIQKFYQQYKAYITVDLIMYASMVLVIVLGIVVVKVFFSQK